MLVRALGKPKKISSKMRKNKLKQLWEEGKTAINAWLTIPSAWTAETMAHTGFDAITIDMQHGLADYQTTLSMLHAISTTDAVPLARVPWNEPATIMRPLDAGVYGLVCPMVNSREEAEAFVGACRYPPLGFRSYGPIRANVYAGEDVTKMEPKVTKIAPKWTPKNIKMEPKPNNKKNLKNLLGNWRAFYPSDDRRKKSPTTINCPSAVAGMAEGSWI